MISSALTFRTFQQRAGTLACKAVRPAMAARVLPMRMLSSSAARFNEKVHLTEADKYSVDDAIAELSRMAEKEDLIAPGTKGGNVPTDIEHATGLERLELISKLAGEDFFDFSTLPADRLGTLSDPIKVDSYYHTRFVGCTGSPADSHQTVWMPLSTKDVVRCTECGSVYAMNYLGDPALADGDHGHH